MRAFVFPALFVAALLSFPSPAAAQNAPASSAPVLTTNPFTGVDFLTATVFQEGQTSFSGVALRARMQNARVVSQMDFLPTVEYWQTNVSALGFRTTRRDATLGGFARWTFPSSRAWNPYLGAGLGIHFMHSAVQSPDTRIEDDTVRGAVAAIAGLSFGNNERFGNFLELELHHLGGERQLKFNMGMSWNINVHPAP
ncbi:MAG: hypothetical protein IT348_18750 [Candidatus Eisenbacteria bacterium]|nr:hypothetical protein [Candidatus Eisenbacteria bacterium]